MNKRRGDICVENGGVLNCEKEWNLAICNVDEPRSISGGFPGGASGKESACQCRRCLFHPWVREILWRRMWQPTLVLLPGESHGQRSLVCYSPWGHKKLDTFERQHNQQQPLTLVEWMLPFHFTSENSGRLSVCDSCIGGKQLRELSGLGLHSLQLLLWCFQHGRPLRDHSFSGPSTRVFDWGSERNNFFVLSLC